MPARHSNQKRRPRPNKNQPPSTITPSCAACTSAEGIPWERACDALAESVMFLDRESRILHANHASSVLFGTPPAQLVGRHCWEVIHSGEGPVEGCPFRKMLQSGRREMMTLALGAKVFRITVDPILDSEGRLVGAVHVAGDITAEIQATESLVATARQLSEVARQLTSREAQLEKINERLREQALRLSESEARYRSVVECSPLGMHFYRLEPDGRLVFTGANPAADRILGVENAQFIGKTLEEAFPALAATEIPARYREVASRGGVWHTEHVNYEDEQIRGAYEVVAFQVSPGAMVAVFSDITARKRAEDLLRREHALVTGITEASPLGIVVVNRDGHVTFANRAAELYLGLSRSEATQRTYNDPRWKITALDGGPFPDEELPFCRVMRTGRAVFDVRHAVERPDGVRTPLSINAAPLFAPDGTLEGMVATLEDISVQLRAEEELRNRQRLESLGVLAGGIAHDFNNLLTAVFGNIDMARTFGTVDLNARQYLDRAMEAFKRAKDLTQQLLTFSKGGAPQKRRIVLVKVVKQAAELALSGSGVRCEFDLPDDLPPVEADEGQISQVVHNLVLNARQAMAERGTMGIRVGCVTVSAEDSLPLVPGRYVLVAVSDTGVGIPAEHLPRIFDPFFTTKQQGSGLGLAIAYSIVRKHDGHIAVESVVGKGTTVRVYLPVSGGGTAMQEQETGPTVHRGTGRVLVMDDEAVVRGMACEMLRRLGYETVECADGAQAVELYRAAMSEGRPFDVVLLDLTVPGGMGGAEAMRAIRDLDPSARGIVSSGYAGDPVLARFSDYGFAAAVPKPYRIQELGSTLAALISSPCSR